MIYDHEAIRRVNSNITRIVDGGEISDASGAIYTYGKEITQEQVDQARREINAELAATKYQRDREAILGQKKWYNNLGRCHRKSKNRLS